MQSDSVLSTDRAFAETHLLHDKVVNDLRCSLLQVLVIVARQRYVKMQIPVSNVAVAIYIDGFLFFLRQNIALVDFLLRVLNNLVVA